MYPAGIAKFCAYISPESASSDNSASRLAFSSAAFFDLLNVFSASSSSFFASSILVFPDSICELADANPEVADNAPDNAFL